MICTHRAGPCDTQSRRSAQPAQPRSGSHSVGAEPSKTVLTASAIMSDPVPTSNGRHVDGRFTPGNAIGKGNPGNRRQRELREALLECATPEKVKAVEEALHELAVGGDVAAAKVWLDHVVGKPLQAVQAQDRSAEV